MPISSHRCRYGLGLTADVPVDSLARLGFLAMIVLSFCWSEVSDQCVVRVRHAERSWWLEETLLPVGYATGSQDATVKMQQP